jgi:hypothetical protein
VFPRRHRSRAALPGKSPRASWHLSVVAPGLGRSCQWPDPEEQGVNCDRAAYPPEHRQPRVRRYAELSRCQGDASSPIVCRRRRAAAVAAAVPAHRRALAGMPRGSVYPNQPQRQRQVVVGVPTGFIAQRALGNGKRAGLMPLRVKAAPIGGAWQQRRRPAAALRRQKEAEDQRCRPGEGLGKGSRIPAIRRRE